MNLIINVIAAIILSLLCSCTMIESSNNGSNYGVQEINFPKQQSSIYFKREVRGLNFDALWISSNRDPCYPINKDSDIVFSALNHTVFYKQTADSLYLYSTSPIDWPTNNTFVVKIIYNEIGANEFFSFEESYAAHGLKKLKIEIDPKLICK